ncbi:hypothetical protein [Novosphingobium sp.]|uniref:hypothetical protein n=1 Tax=Novosphingobium sp. TaxID=1874826 RepID=UPI003342DA64
MPEVALFFTAKSVERILADGGTSSWRLDRKHARKCAFAICTRNAYAEWVEGPEAHHSAFLIGKVRDVVPTNDPDSDMKNRYLVQFSEYALVAIPEVWKGDRNPVRYADMDELGIELADLVWQPMPAVLTDISERYEVPKHIIDVVQPLTMNDAKKGLALMFGVSPEAIEITIRG